MLRVTRSRRLELQVKFLIFDIFTIHDLNSNVRWPICIKIILVYLFICNGISIALGPMTSKVHKIWQNLMERSRLLYPCLFYRDLQVWTRGIVRPAQTVHILGCILKNPGTQLELDIVKVKLFSFHKVCVCKFNGDFLIPQLLFTIKSLRILISNSLSSGNSKHNDSITMIFWLGHIFIYIYANYINAAKHKILNYIFFE